MGQAFLVNLDRKKYGMRGLISEGKQYNFDIMGSFLGETPIDSMTSTLQQVEVVSLLVSGTTLELGVLTNNTFTKLDYSKSFASVVMKLNSLKGLLMVGEKKGILEGVSYTQYFYIFLPNSVHLSMLRG